MKANHISLNYQWKLKLRIKHHDIYIKSIQRNIQNQIQRSNSSTLFSNLWSVDKRCSVFIEWRLNTLGCFWISLYILVFLCKRLERFCRYQHVDSRVLKTNLVKEPTGLQNCIKEYLVNIPRSFTSYFMFANIKKMQLYWKYDIE